MNKTLTIILAIVAVGLIVASQAFYIVDQREQAILLQLGQPVGDNPDDPASFIKGPGIHMKIPIVQEVRYFDSRVLSLDPRSDQVVISNEQVSRQSTQRDLENNQQTGEPADGPVIDNVSGEPIIVDTFARYRITDPLQFLKTLATINNANERLGSILTDATRSVLGQTTLGELLSDRRQNVMANIQARVNNSVKGQFGLEVIDVRIVRADLTADLRTSTVRRMISELKERATETRAVGEEEALKIRSEAEKERTVILAKAERDAQILRGEGDEEAIKIYTSAFNKDKEFYSFIRSLEAYRNTLADPETQLILSPDSEFFRHFESLAR